ncbi:hypothetical protein K6U21_05375 [Vibrio vulnificus]|nr:hypothetical protein [Vibrio vulnificus]
MVFVVKVVCGKLV